MTAATPLRVLMVNTHGNVGGAARMAATLARALNATGEVEARLYHCGDREKKPPLYGIRRFGGRHLNVALARFGGSLMVQDLGVADEIIRESRNADVIHLHNLHGYYLDWDRLVRALGDRPLVWTWHDWWGVTGRCALSLGCEGWRTGCDPCPHLQFYPAAWFDRAAQEYRRKGEWLAQASRMLIVTPSTWLRQIAIDRGIAEEKLVHIPNPVDVASFRPVPVAEARRALGLSPERRYLLFLANDCNSPIKGYPHFLDTVERTRWRGLVVGGIPRKIPDFVEFLGSFLHASDLSHCYSAADALVAPSVFDNTPNTVIEAMACGTPAFGFATGGMPSQMHPRWGGVVPVGDSEALAALLVDQLGGDGKTDGMVAELRDHAVSRWRAEQSANAYLEVYRRVLKSS